MDLSADISAVNLVINRVTLEIYDELVRTHQIHEDEIYCVDETYLDAKGNRIVNVASLLLSTDAANKAYVDMKSKTAFRDWYDIQGGL